MYVTGSISILEIWCGLFIIKWLLFYRLYIYLVIIRVLKGTKYVPVVYSAFFLRWNLLCCVHLVENWFMSLLLCKFLLCWFHGSMRVKGASWEQISCFFIIWKVVYSASWLIEFQDGKAGGLKWKSFWSWE